MFRNREIRQSAVSYILITAVSVFTGFLVCPGAGILALFSAVSYGTAFFLWTKARYRRIAQLSEQIDLVLHNADRLYIGGEGEGELSILQSEITKMMLRIREQNDALRREKEHLADSLADIAHQLRTPLTSMNLILSLLESETVEGGINDGQYNNQRRELLQEMEALLVRMDWLVTSLLKLSRLDAGVIVFQKQKVAVHDLIDTALRPLLISMDLHDISVQVNFDCVKKEVSEEIQISGDREWLAEAVRNILKNCMESIGDKGKIEINCEDTLLYTELSVHDSGKGIAEDDLPCLFDRFYQGKNSGTAGYGIGLALSKMIITKQGGTVTARNHPEGGAVFYIRFPK
ncbi:MAG: HAMP domain-containing histidine kinase [Lachnospiraceae bacterium]|nr:HAMP domain-containing histidine kinase [Lachnospiraceae bacterium]